MRAAWSSSCSRNAHDKNVLVRRAHLRIDQAALIWGTYERAWKDHLYRSTCAVGDQVRPPSWREIGELGGEKGRVRRSFLLAERAR
jgi:hypothetical protein